MDHLDKALAALKKYFGYENFRPQQAEIIERVCAGKDGLVLMPTGGGKSICYQIPALIMPGTTVVVSPLISLMQDQVDGLRANGVRAAYLNSSLTSREAMKVEDDFSTGELKLLYVSPEKLLSAGFTQMLKRHRVNLFAVDEAHCISAWGHDFRPEYTQLAHLKRMFPETPVLALTATADRLTRIDILSQLSIPEARQFITSFDRPNLSLEVRPGQKKKEQIVDFVRRHPDQPGIIYCLSRKSTESLAADLSSYGFSAQCYHAGLAAGERMQIQRDFINDKVDIVCATIAFGMGIDKSNVRWVIHYNMPKNLENYYQEIGRSGRDGTPADTLLFYSYNDYTTMLSMLNQGENTEVALAKLERMKEYAESLACRRRILLNYFSEDSGEDCGNCDICANPPQRFDGTVPAQMALSAVARLREQVGVGLTIDVLRGSVRQDIVSRGYDRIKTYGAGRNTSTYDWQQYLMQLINLGYLYVAHEDHGKLRLTAAARRVLFEGEGVELVKMQTVKDRREAEKKKAKRAVSNTPTTGVRDGLFEELRLLRRKLAQKFSIPPYLVFSDKTLEEMAATRPTTDADLARVNGVGERKLQRFGDDFLELIRENVAATSGKHAITGTNILSYDLYAAGKTVDEIAAERGIKPGTVRGHLFAAVKNGKAYKIEDFASPGLVAATRKAVPYLEKPVRLKALKEYLGDEAIEYDELRFALLAVMQEMKAEMQ